MITIWEANWTAMATRKGKSKVLKFDRSEYGVVYSRNYQFLPIKTQQGKSEIIKRKEWNKMVAKSKKDCLHKENSP